MIGDAWGFSGKTPIAPSRGFSVETLTGATLSWKTELNRSNRGFTTETPSISYTTTLYKTSSYTVIR